MNTPQKLKNYFMLIGILSDIHSDYNSLKKAKKILESRNCDLLVCLGDIVGYSSHYTDYFKHGQAKDCISFVLSECEVVVMGNHDLYALRKTPLFNAGFKYPENWYNLRLRERKNLANHKLWLYEEENDDLVISKELREKFENVPEFKTHFLEEKLVMFSHYLYPDLSGSTTFRARHFNDFSEHNTFMQKYECSLAFTGHHHYEGVEIIKDQQYRKFPYGDYSIGYGQAIIKVPCIAKGAIKNGVTIYHPEKGGIEVVPIE